MQTSYHIIDAKYCSTGSFIRFEVDRSLVVYFNILQVYEVTRLNRHAELLDVNSFALSLGDIESHYFRHGIIGYESVLRLEVGVCCTSE